MINKNKLKELVSALDALSDDVKDWDVAMGSIDKPLCGTPGCHAGLISIVAKELPELQDIYNDDYRIYDNRYEYDIWADALTVFLGFAKGRGLEDWAECNPEIWGNENGFVMFSSRSAFTNDPDKQLNHRDIINHWKQVLKNIENEGVKT